MARRPYTYSKEEILADLTRTAETLGCVRLTKGLYDTHGTIATSTVMRHFGGWLKALKAAGMACAVNDRRETSHCPKIENTLLKPERGYRRWRAATRESEHRDERPTGAGLFVTM